MNLQVITIEVEHLIDYKAKVLLLETLTKEAAVKEVQKVFADFISTFKKLGEETPLLYDFLQQNLVSYLWFDTEEFETEEDFVKISIGEFLGLMLKNPYKIYFDKVVSVN